ncbi:MAG: gephyrin-like molybdotransferase Glp [Novosphingobium sp.]
MRTPPLPLEEAQARLLALAEPLSIEHVAIEGTLGRYLAAPVAARRTQPFADLSAMDGYAMAPGDMAGPWQVIGESAAGHPFAGEVRPGTAARISTGAIMPAGADIVILQEDIARKGNRISLTGEPPSPPDKHIRRSGLDFAAGSEVLSPGVRIGPAQAALAIAAGHSHLAVHRSPRVAVIDSGDELARDLDSCAAHQVPASNGVMLAAMARALSCEVKRLGPVPDDRDAITAALAQAARADVIVTSGGASVGDHDLIRPALADWGASLDFWRVAIKPGKPILVARRGGQLVLGLPGNPVSSHITAFLFLLPVLRRLLGAADPLPRRVRALLAHPLRANGARREFLRASWDGESVTAQPIQDSAALAPLAASNALIDRPAGAPAAQAGESVAIHLLGNGGIA